MPTESDTFTPTKSNLIETSRDANAHGTGYVGWIQPQMSATVLDSLLTPVRSVRL